MLTTSKAHSGYKSPRCGFNSMEGYLGRRESGSSRRFEARLSSKSCPACLHSPRTGALVTLSDSTVPRTSPDTFSKGYCCLLFSGRVLFMFCCTCYFVGVFDEIVWDLISLHFLPDSAKVFFVLLFAFANTALSFCICRRLR